MQYITHLKTKGGLVRVTATETAITGIDFVQKSIKDRPNSVTNQAVRQLQEYFAGQRREFQLPLEMKGTPFQMAVWKELLKIPYGESTTYGDIAKKLKNPGAGRAVGSANGKNPISIVVPCHRVIASRGGLGGYSGGLDKKRYLLALEKIPYRER